MSLRSHILKTTRSNFTKFSVHVMILWMTSRLPIMGRQRRRQQGVYWKWLTSGSTRGQSLASAIALLAIVETSNYCSITSITIVVVDVDTLLIISPPTVAGDVVPTRLPLEHHFNVSHCLSCSISKFFLFPGGAIPGFTWRCSCFRWLHVFSSDPWASTLPADPICVPGCCWSCSVARITWIYGDTEISVKLLHSLWSP